jgi:hypothetical protein
MGRPPKGDRAMTAAERQRNRRKRMAEQRRTAMAAKADLIREVLSRADELIARSKEILGVKRL